jgi:hypothetical protein
MKHSLVAEPFGSEAPYAVAVEAAVEVGVGVGVGVGAWTVFSTITVFGGR